MLLIISSHNPQIMRRNATLLDAANDIFYVIVEMTLNGSYYQTVIL